MYIGILTITSTYEKKYLKIVYTLSQSPQKWSLKFKLILCNFGNGFLNCNFCTLLDWLSSIYCTYNGCSS